MSDYEQTALDMRLESERTIAENIMTTIKFVEAMTVDGDNPPSKVRNRHEAYGIAAERFSAVNGAIKSIKGDMEQLLRTLADPNYPALEAVSSLCNSSARAANIIIEMAAEMQRTLSDLYTYETVGKTPLEELAESAEDDFEEADPADADEY